MDYGLADGSKEPNLLTVTLHARQPEAGLADFVVDSVLHVTVLSGRREERLGRMYVMKRPFVQRVHLDRAWSRDDPVGFSTVWTTVGDGSREPNLLAVFFMPVSPRELADASKNCREFRRDASFRQGALEHRISTAWRRTTNVRISSRSTLGIPLDVGQELRDPVPAKGQSSR